MYCKEVTIKNATGLHARPASNFAMKAMSFKSAITIARKNDSSKEFNAKSLMKILSLGIAKDEEIIIKANGEDEEIAVNALVEFIDSGCGEN